MDISAKTVFLKKLIAWSTLGNLHYEKGDMSGLISNSSMPLTAPEELKKEIINGGFELIDIQVIAGKEFAGAIARKPF